MILILLRRAQPRSAVAATPAKQPKRPAPPSEGEHRDPPAREHGPNFTKEDDLNLLLAVQARGCSNWDKVLEYGQKNMKNVFGWVTVCWWEAVLSLIACLQSSASLQRRFGKLKKKDSWVEGAGEHLQAHARA